MAGHAADMEDVAALIGKMQEGFPSDHREGIDIQVEHVFPIVDVAIAKRCLLCETGGIDDNIDAAESTGGEVYRIACGSGIREIHGKCEGPISLGRDLSDQIGEPVFPAREKGEIGSRIREAKGNGSADSARGSGHEGFPSIQRFGVIHVEE